MIVTLTANPSLDRTIVLDATLRPGEVQSVASVREDAGGKGINVSRVLDAAGADTVAVLPLSDDDPLRGPLHASRVAIRTVAVGGHCRANVTITDPAGVTTKLNQRGAVLAHEESDALIAEVVAASEGADWLVLAGSLPPGVGSDYYVDVIRAVRERWGEHAPRIAVDASGPALQAVVDSAHPDLIKPNDEELAELAGVEIDPDGEPAAAVLAVARRIVPDRVEAALVTLGAHGAVLVAADDAHVATPPPIRVRSTVGAGDSSLAGYLLADLAGADAADRLRSAVRHGSAAASLPGTQAPHPEDLPAGDIPVAVLTP